MWAVRQARQPNLYQWGGLRVALFFFLMKIELKLNIAAIIRWERLTDRSFATLDLGDEDDVLRLLYCASKDAIESESTYEVFANAMRGSKRMLNAALRAINRHNAYIAQFQHAEPKGQSNAKNDNPERIGAIAARLIVQGGMSPDFVLNNMPLDDISVYAEALSEQFKREEESRRLWTFFSVLPHVKEGALKTVKDLYRFPWEEAEIASRAEADLAKLRATEHEFREQLKTAEWKQFKL